MLPAGDRKWYTHGWNTDRSWKLILAVIPRVPPFLRLPIHLVATLVCFLSMREERRAARRNLARVAGKQGKSGLLAAFRLFYNFSKFMVAYTDLPPYGRGVPDSRMACRGEERSRLDALLARGRGVIVLGAHLGQWDMALTELARLGHPVTVVMRREEEESARFSAAVREAAGVRVVHTAESPWAMVELLAALRRNEIIALHGDRPFGGRSARVEMFGAPLEVPTGPTDLAAASGAPLLPGVVIFEGHRRYSLVLGSPLGHEMTAGAEPAPPTPQAMAAALETMIRRYPHQWFNFYDVWEKVPGAEAVRGSRRLLSGEEPSG